MSQIIKTFTGIYILLFLMSAGTGLLGAFLQVLQAQNMHSMVIDELENSDYAMKILEDAFTVVEAKGAQLRVRLYLEDGTQVDCEEAEDVPDTSAKVRIAQVQIVYPIMVPLMGVSEEYALTGYAR